MVSEEREVSYRTQNSYSVLNSFTEKTRNVWFACHGMGYLSRFFIRHFKSLNAEENYIIAPQSPSKYYLKTDYKNVGAGWLTKENTIVETENIMRYFDAILEHEQFSENENLIFLGYSQGVSVALRYLASRQITCSKIAIMSGGIPKELNSSAFQYLSPKTQVKLIYGLQDPLLTDERMKFEKSRATELFGHCNLQIIPFEGGHEVNSEIIKNLSV